MGLPVGPPQGGVPILPQPGQPAPMREGEYQSGSVANVTKFAFDNVAPPSPLYVQRDDILFIDVISSIANATVFVTGRFLRVPEPQGGQPDQGGVGRTPGAIFTRGIIEQIGQTILAPTPRSDVRTQLALAEGYLLSLGISADNTGDRGRTLVRASLVRPGTNLFHPGVTLVSDYCTQFGGIGWPGGRVLGCIEGPGWRHSLNVPNPGAGADWTLTALNSQRLAVTSFSATFVAAASAASRNITIIVDDGANTVWQDDVTASVTISQTATVNGAQTQATAGIVATTLFVVLPPGLILSPAFRIRSSTANIQGGDQWQNIWFSVEEWIDNF